MRFARSQKGMSLLGWLVVLGVVAFFASAAFKIIPHYMDYYSLEKVITSVETDKAAEVRSVPEFYSYVGKGMQINGIRNLDLEKALEVQLEDNQFRAHLKYEKTRATDQQHRPGGPLRQRIPCTHAVSNSLDRLERKLGYTFKDRDLMVLALTHRSYAGRNNERLGSSVTPFSTSSSARRCSTTSRRLAKASFRACARDWSRARPWPCWRAASRWATTCGWARAS